MKMEKACDVYLAVLNGCGIRLPEDDDNEDDDAAGDLSSADATSTNVEFDPTFSNVVPFNNIVVDACAALIDGDFDWYTLKMRDAHAIDARRIASKNSDITLLDFEDVLVDENPSRDIRSAIESGAIGGFWAGVSPLPVIAIDSATFEHNIAIMSSTLPFTITDPQTGHLNGLVVNGRTGVIGLLDQIIELGTTCQEWVKEMPGSPTTHAERKIASRYRDKAATYCKLAQNSARLANNAFTDFNHEATEFQLSLQRQMSNSRMKSKQARPAESHCKPELRFPGLNGSHP